MYHFRTDLRSSPYLGEFGWSILDNYQLLAAPVMGIDLKESRPLTTVKTESRSDFTCSPCYHLLNVIKIRKQTEY